jgi:hypothetical protein
MKTRGSFAGLFLIQAFVILLLAYGNLWARPIIVKDDFNDGDTSTQVPPDPGETSPAGEWEFTASCNYNNVNCLSIEYSTTGSAYLKWEPKPQEGMTPPIYLPNPYAIIENLDLSFSITHSSPSFLLRWDECWNANDVDADSVLESSPEVVLAFNFQTWDGETSGEEESALRLVRNAGNRETDAYFFLWFWWFPLGETPISWPQGYNPTNGDCYRYKVSRDLYCNLEFNAVKLDQYGNETQDSFLLWSLKECVKEDTIGGTTAISQEALIFTGLEFGALRTDDGYDASIDNVELWSLATDWNANHPANFDHYVDLRDIKNILDGTTLVPGENLPNGDTTLNRAVDYCTNIYLPPQQYTNKPGKIYINNPLEIERDYPLFITGIMPRYTLLSPSNLDENTTYGGNINPLFILKRAPVVNFTSVAFSPPSTNNSNHTIVDSRSIFVPADADIGRLEMLASSMEKSVIDIQGGGTYIFQANNFNPYGYACTPIILDNSSAELFLISNNITDNGSASNLCSDKSNAYHVWQKHGRLAIYIGSVQNQIGPADFRIDSPSQIVREGTTLPHVIAGIRSEGTPEWYWEKTCAVGGERGCLDSRNYCCVQDNDPTLFIACTSAYDFAPRTVNNTTIRQATRSSASG